ncbi:hypothetical protein [Trujillonella endophytica]|uniref:DUF4126 domain-containing protein n=1 Tax=Trujillonella endophytica TaxID=673521 RepID=A0A1H8PEK6_9ACTN|nr:hypothetical protein [Trujillella endophytica]SEO40078.1 hypothetical protein SAMN05660991_00122 [Trujillella endophytica]
MPGTFTRGLVAGAAGTTVLTAVTYLDMAIRGRPASTAPERTVDALAAVAGAQVPGRGRVLEDRRTALGALAGIGTGLATGVLASVARSAGIRLPGPVGAVATGATAMAACDIPIAVLGVGDPRTWSRADWLADAVPHLAYGATVHGIVSAVRTDRERAVPRGAASAGLTLRSAALGVAAGSRAALGFAGPTLTAPTKPGRLGGSSVPARALAAAALVGELVADKSPDTPDRTEPGGLVPRLVGATAGATRLAERERANAALPAAAAGVGAVAGAFGGLAWRRWASTRLPDLSAALVEDGVALALAALACLPGRNRRPLAVVPG